MGSKKLEKEVVLKWADTWLSLFNEASAINFFKVAPSLNCPVYFFVGAKDIQTSNTITSEYYNTVRAEKKKLYLFENTAHNLPTAQPVRLQETIIKDILIE